MKSIDFFCASPASTAICSSIDHRTNVAPCLSSNKPSHDKPRKSFTHKSDKLLRRKSSADVEDLVKLRASSRYLLSDDQSFLDSSKALLPVMGNNAADRDNYYKTFSTDGFRGKMSDHVKGHELQKNPSNPQANSENIYQEWKASVTSFSIDLATKKVTVTGDVSPLGVLKSISKVKNAQFWASSNSSSSSSTSSPRVSLTR
ncbi:heavy metal transport/detoxification superfamily protein [Striga asiatica]|uniref:Heavy metal transport/detoxification superfamily protein n=1 Tax=Striga asiatica TaxID=4170 RepID=A0A5A7P9Z6_STRAF|nr:heavy metal transport/detoxification superfamily protein [Striga asiatica]